MTVALLHDLSDGTVLIIGGGPVALRKARLFQTESDVFVISPDFEPALPSLATCIRATVDEASFTEWLSRIDPVLVVAATDDGTLNGMIERTTVREGILINRVDTSAMDHSLSVNLPAMARNGDLIFAVGTGGQSPRLARALLDDFDGSTAGQMATFLGVLRMALDDAGIEQSVKATTIEAVVSSSGIWRAIDRGGDVGSAIRMVLREALGVEAYEQIEPLCSDALRQIELHESQSAYTNKQSNDQ